VSNDTTEPARVDFKFAEGQSTCRTPGSFADSVDLAAGRHFPFVCPSSEIASISITQHGRTCALDREELIKLSGELTVSSCLSGHPARAR